MAVPGWGDIYDELGVTPVINAIGSVTLLGGSQTSPTVRDAMERANSAYVPLAELEDKAGGLIADMLGVESAYITSGAASALVLSTAAAMARDNDDFVAQLPDTTGMADEILIQKKQRYHYDRTLNFAGAKLIEYGTDEGTSEEDLEAAINDKTAALHYVANEKIKDPSVLTIEQVITIAKKHDIPVIVDAAGQVYPTENMGKYAKLGADMVAYGTKYIGTPHSAGMVVGSKTWIDRVRLNSFISFEERRVRGIGRPQKIDRQEIVGVAAAVREWLTMNHEERIAKLDVKLTHIERAITGIPGVKVEADRDPTGASVFNLFLTIDEKVCGISEDEVVAQLKDGDPPIWTRVNPYFGGMQVGMVGLNDGEEQIVAERLVAALKG
ncbi:MAG TPA: aminotransferase class V-fold PLP-dependent enzyme [Dehalococcoidia bacterium]|jgi:L-seryl-tRNA(Ser) seleniumtransferase|nr:aminotransferase class V-fold PLP-dependent enzyme [Dehalococcoidia bacterium]HIK99275.1 aminotransferase class V-fold PLP-dependent enzyme [Dehalococcoidia bacterium]